MKDEESRRFDPSALTRRIIGETASPSTRDLRAKIAEAQKSENLRQIRTGQPKCVCCHKPTTGVKSYTRSRPHFTGVPKFEYYIVRICDECWNGLRNVSRDRKTKRLKWKIPVTWTLLLVVAWIYGIGTYMFFGMVITLLQVWFALRIGDPWAELERYPSERI